VHKTITCELITESWRVGVRALVLSRSFSDSFIESKNSESEIWIVTRSTSTSDSDSGSGSRSRPGL
jgi:hypothetical protein